MDFSQLSIRITILPYSNQSFLLPCHQLALGLTTLFDLRIVSYSMPKTAQLSIYSNLPYPQIDGDRVPAGPLALVHLPLCRL